MPAASPLGLDFPDVAEAIREMRKGPAGGRGRRSPIYLWLHMNHDRLLAEFQRNAPSWERLVAFLGQSGLRDGEGKTPTVRNARDTWYRVRSDVKALRARQETEDGTAEVAPGVRLAPEPKEQAVARDPFGPADDEQPRRAFKLATLKGMEPGATPPQPAPPPSAEPPLKPAGEAVQDPDEVISRLFGRPQASGFTPTPAKKDE